METAHLFQDRRVPGDWRVEWTDDDGAVEVAIFSGPNARERALAYADRQYGNFRGNHPSPVSMIGPTQAPLAPVMRRLVPAAKEAKNQTWVQFQLRFGRFLAFSENSPSGTILTERRFRQYWEQSDDAHERGRFRHIVAMIEADARAPAN